MKTDDFLKDFIGESEVVTVSAVQLKKLLLEQDKYIILIGKLSQDNATLKKSVDALKQQLIWQESQKLRYIDLEA